MRSIWREPEHVAHYLERDIPHRDVAEQEMLEALLRQRWADELESSETGEFWTPAQDPR